MALEGLREIETGNFVRGEDLRRDLAVDDLKDRIFAWIGHNPGADFEQILGHFKKEDPTHLDAAVELLLNQGVLGFG